MKKVKRSGNVVIGMLIREKRYLTAVTYEE